MAEGAQPELLEQRDPVICGSRVRYPHPLEAYTGTYKRNVRNLKHWIDIGKKASPQDLPPLEYPERLADWWARHMKQRVPDDLLALKKEASPSVGKPESEMSRDILPEGEEVGIGAMLDRLRDAEVRAGRKYTEAVIKDDPQADALLRKWERLAEQVRKVEKDAGRLQEGSGELVPRKVVRDGLLKFHSSMAVRIRNFLRGVRPRLRGVGEDEQDRLWEEEVDRLYQDLQGEGILPA